MKNQSSRLHQLVTAEVNKQRQATPHPPNAGNAARLLGLFLQVNLTLHGKTPNELGAALELESELVDAILEGLLPASQLDDDLLIDLAQFIGYAPNILRIILKQNIIPSNDNQNASAHH